MTPQIRPAPPRPNSSRSSDAKQSLALVLGATGGLGQAYCHALARRNLDLILSGRNTLMLEKLRTELVAEYDVNVTTHVADLSVETDLQGVLHLIQNNEKLDWLINAAGLAQWGQFRELPSDNEQAMFQINLLTPLRLVRAAIEAFDSRGGGKVVHIASAAAFFTVPFLSGYCASKTAIVQWLRSIRHEFGGKKIYLQALCPGFVKTDMFAKAGASADKLPRWIWMSPERVVRESLRSLDCGRTVCVPGRRYRIMIFGMKWVPSAISVRVAAWMFGDFAKYRIPLS